MPFPELLRTGGGLAFAGRVGELELLNAAWKEAAAGQRRAVLVGGEPGVGKPAWLSESSPGVLGDIDAALAHHQSAAETIEACGASRARALNDYQWAVALLTRGAPGDRRRAVDMAEWPTAARRATPPS